MLEDLGLSGNELLLYAIIWHFNKKLGVNFCYTKKDVAKYLNTTERTLYRSISELKHKNLIKGKDGSKRCFELFIVD